MTINIYRGPFIYIPDKLHPGSYKMVKNPDWDGELPDIITFTEFLKWNYTLDYGQYIRNLHEYGLLPLPWGVKRDTVISNVIIIMQKNFMIQEISFVFWQGIFLKAELKSKELRTVLITIIMIRPTGKFLF